MATIKVLVVAGGGYAGSNTVGNGGGGAGGFLYETSNSVNFQSYTVIVGTKGTRSSMPGHPGTNSVFDIVTVSEQIFMPILFVSMIRGVKIIG